MAHSTPKDPMATPLLIGGLALIGIAVFVLVSSLFSTIEKNSTKSAEDQTMQTAAADVNLKPIGLVAAVDKSIVKAARSGE
ncbi:MAG: cytochrome c5 family protein, partial [Thiothrix sp.]